MESFKKFITKINLGAPFQVFQGWHSLTPEEKKNKLGPSFRVRQGKHSEPKKDDVKEETQTTKKPPSAYQFLMYHHEGNINSHIAPTAKEVQQHLEAHYTLHGHPGWKHLENYSRSSDGVNSSLHFLHSQTGDPYHPTDSMGHKETVQGLDEALSHKPLHVSLNVMSGLKKNPEILMGKKSFFSPEQRLYHPAYMSTSIKPDVAGNFAEKLTPGSHNPAGYSAPHELHFLHAHLEPGQHGFYLGSRSNYDHEHEFLMPRRTIFKIEGRDIHRISHDINNTIPAYIHIWHAKVVNPDGKP